MSEPFRIVIPSRFASTRLPGKPLLPIAGRSMIARVWDRAKRAGAEEVVVATDDERIAEEVGKIGGKAVMTSTEHASGTDRLAEVCEKLGWEDDAIVVNLQGDEPCIPVELLQQVAADLSENPRAGIATMATPIHTAEELFSDNAVKVVRDDGGFACYFSRAPMPWVRGLFAPGKIPENLDATALPDDLVFLRHLGLYAYRAGVLRRLAAAAQSASEKAESLEQLRALSMGIEIFVGLVDEPPPPGVDTEADRKRAEEFFAS